MKILKARAPMRRHVPDASGRMFMSPTDTSGDVQRSLDGKPRPPRLQKGHQVLHAKGTATQSFLGDTFHSLQKGTLFGTSSEEGRGRTTSTRVGDTKEEESGRGPKPVVLFFLRTQTLALGKSLSLSQEEREAPSLGSFSLTKPCNLLFNPAI